MNIASTWSRLRKSGLFHDDEGTLRPWVGYAAYSITILVGAYLLYGAWIGSDNPQQVNLKCRTQGCPYASKKKLQPGGSFPMQCPRCGEDSLVPAFPCANCNTPVILNSMRGDDSPTLCPECGQEVWYGQ